MSCAAKQNKVAVVANFFVTHEEDNKNYITTLVFDKTGKVVTTYDKNHLFPTEMSYVEAGPFLPTVFSIDNFKFGLIICYEGFYPSTTGDYSQMEKLVEDGAEIFLWSVGGTGLSAAMRS
jgi:predicted amidohydrolase